VRVSRLILLLVFSISFVSAMGQKSIRYNKYSWFEGVSKAREDSKFFLMYISQPGCEYCKELDGKTLRDPSLIKFLNDNFVLVRHQVTSAYGRAIALDYHLSTTPALMIQNPKSDKKPLILYGVKDAEALRKELEDYIQSEKGKQ
jgi:thioredoxin-related protein